MKGKGLGRANVQGLQFALSNSTSKCNDFNRARQQGSTFSTC